MKCPFCGNETFIKRVNTIVKHECRNPKCHYYGLLIGDDNTVSPYKFVVDESGNKVVYVSPVSQIAHE